MPLIIILTFCSESHQACGSTQAELGMYPLPVVAGLVAFVLSESRAQVLQAFSDDLYVAGAAGLSCLSNKYHGDVMVCICKRICYLSHIS